MPLTAVCPGCSAKITAPDAAAGKNVRCPKCKGVIPVPAPEAEEGFEVVEDVAQTKPAKKRRVVVEGDEEQPRRKKKRRRDEDEEDDEEKGGVSLARNLIMGAVLLVLLAVAGYVFYTKLKQPDDDGLKGGNPAQAK